MNSFDYDAASDTYAFDLSLSPAELEEMESTVYDTEALPPFALDSEDDVAVWQGWEFTEDGPISPDPLFDVIERADDPFGLSEDDYIAMADHHAERYSRWLNGDVGVGYHGPY